MDKIFVDGVNVYNPHPNSPDFVKGSLVIKYRDLLKWIDENGNRVTQDKNGNDQIRLQIKESREGKLYAELDTYQPNGNAVIAQAARDNARNLNPVEDDDSLPF